MDWKGNGGMEIHSGREKLSKMATQGEVYANRKTIHEDESENTHLVLVTLNNSETNAFSGG